MVTGANGQLGSELKTIAGEMAGGGFFFTDIPEMDITDGEAVGEYLAANEIDVIVNCAAYTNVDKAESDSENAFRINADGPRALAAAAGERNATLVHISTDYVFDGRARTPYKEDGVTNPTGVYGESKLAGERAVADSNCKSVIIRTSWLYSSFGHNFVKTMLRLGGERPEINVVADQTGTPTYARDLAKAILHIVPQIVEKPQYGEIYHFSDDGVCTWYDFASKIMEFSQTDCKVLPITSAEYPTPVTRPAYSVLDKSRIKKIFGVEVPRWENSLKECLNELATPNNR